MSHLLVTGSRHYEDAATVRRVLTAFSGSGLVLMHGGAPGLDTLARNAWMELGLPALGIRAEWDRYGSKAGPIRNQVMVDIGDHVLCLAFPAPDSVGTWDCVRRAQKAGIPVLEVK